MGCLFIDSANIWHHKLFAVFFQGMNNSVYMCGVFDEFG